MIEDQTPMTATKEQLQVLLERVEKATGPNLALEGEIWCEINGYQFVTWDGAGCVYREAPEAGISHVDGGVVRPYTASIDAALALLERVLPGTNWSISFDDKGDPEKWWVAIVGEEYSEHRGGPALAILAALLHALIAQADA